MSPPDPLHQLVSLRQQLEAYVERWRSLPVELSELASSCASGAQDSADGVGRAIDAITDSRPAPRGEAA
jgi:hypothetical protein